MYATTLNRASLLIVSILLIASQQAAAQAGHLDLTFGNGGIVTSDFGDLGNSNKASPNAVTIQPMHSPMAMNTLRLSRETTRGSPRITASEKRCAPPDP